MPDKRTHAGMLEATTGKPYAHVEEAIADGHMTERARTVAICAAILFANPLCPDPAAASRTAIDLVIRAEEWDRHERLQDRLPPHL